MAALPRPGETVRLTGPLLIDGGGPDPSSPPVGATAVVQDVSGPFSGGWYQLSVRWAAPFERLRLMLLDSDPFVIEET